MPPSRPRHGVAFGPSSCARRPPTKPNTKAPPRDSRRRPKGTAVTARPLARSHHSALRAARAEAVADLLRLNRHGLKLNPWGWSELRARGLTRRDAETAIGDLEASGRARVDGSEGVPTVYPTADAEAAP